MKKIILSLALISFLAFPGLADAQLDVAPTVDPIDTLETIVNILFTFLLVIAAIFIVIAAFYFITAGGDTEKVGKARNMVLYAVIGVIVAILARGLVWYVNQTVG